MLGEKVLGVLVEVEGCHVLGTSVDGVPVFIGGVVVELTYSTSSINNKESLSLYPLSINQFLFALNR